MVLLLHIRVRELNYFFVLFSYDLKNFMHKSDFNIIKDIFIIYSFLKSNIKISEDYLTPLYDRRILEYSSYTVPHLALDSSL